MKTYNKPAASKLVARFDRELRDIIMNDLNILKTKVRFLNTTNNNLLPAA